MWRSCRVGSRVSRWLWGLGLGLVGMTGAANGPAPAFAAGDLIVKFNEASEFGRLLARAARGDGLPDKQLASVATQLSSSLKVALTAVRVTSGRELVLTIERTGFQRVTAQQLSRDPAVRAVTPVDAVPTVLPAAHVDFRMELGAGSEAQHRVQQAVQSGNRTSRGIDALVEKLAAGLSPRPTGHLDDQGALILRFDLATLTRNLVAQLQGRPDVEYAQVSHRVTPYPQQ